MKDAIAMLIACKDSKVVDELQRALGIGEKDQETLDAPLSDGATKRECERGARKAGEVQGAASAGSSRPARRSSTRPVARRRPPSMGSSLSVMR